jgi:mycothiol synthase
MAITVRDYAPSDLETLRALITDPSVAAEFDPFQGPGGLEHKLHDPVLAAAGIRLAFLDGEPAGFGIPWIFPVPGRCWTMLRVGVVERCRRRGVGLALARAVQQYVRALPNGPFERTSSAWMPNPAAGALVARLGGVHDRWFWLMEHPRTTFPEPVWPEGVRVATFDGSDDMLRAWTDAYNESFAEHYRYFPAGLDRLRQMIADPGFRPDGVMIAWRNGAIAGFCRNELHSGRGEIGTLGVVRSSRGIGLGRALLRWGSRWLASAQPNAVTLYVDGENESALGLYRSEGWEVQRSREIWTLPAMPPA